MSLSLSVCDCCKTNIATEKEEFIRHKLMTLCYSCHTFHRDSFEWMAEMAKKCLNSDCKNSVPYLCTECDKDGE